MEITNTTLIRQATATTGNAKYQIEYSIENGKLSRVHASIYGLNPENEENEVNLGSISFDNGYTNCSISGDRGASMHFGDFEEFMVEIKNQVAEGKIEK